MAVNFHSPEAIFDTSDTLFFLYNAYSIADGHHSSVSPFYLFPHQIYPTFVLGDHNIHHPSSDPAWYLSDYEHFIGSFYFDRDSDLSFSFLNTPGVYTRFPFTTTYRLTVLHLSFANNALVPYLSPWNPILLPRGSDHSALSIVLSTPLLKPPPKGLNCKNTDWDHISPVLANVTLPAALSLPTLHTLDIWFNDSLAKITHLITSNTPSRPPSSYSQPWWTPELTQLNERFNLYVNLTITNHHQTPPHALNVLLAFLEIVLGLCK